uniref:Uncharacterized protein n=1 Tax=Salarias fasciatus TaxID=181472 RepID=A0A672IUG2_SALFA
MDQWKVRLAAVTFIALVQTQQGLKCSAEEEAALSTDWQDGTGLTDSVVDLMKRSKALRFYGLMGKRSGNKGEAFVGLMGRSVSSDGEVLFQSEVRKPSDAPGSFLAILYQACSDPSVELYTLKHRRPEASRI